MCTQASQAPEATNILDLEHLIQADPGLADTLAILMDDETMRFIQTCDRELQAEQRMPLEWAMA